MINYSIITNKYELISIEDDWRNLARKFNNPLLDFDWFSTWAELYNSNEPLSIIIIKNGTQISAIAPLVNINVQGINRLELMGTSLIWEPSGLLYSDLSSLNMLLKAMIREKRPIRLWRIESNSQVTNLIKKLNLKNSICIVRDGGSSPFISINSDWDSYLNGLSSRRRYDLRRAQKRANKYGNVEIQILSPKLQSLEELLTEVYVVEAMGWKGAKGSAILKSNHLKKFFSLYSKKATHQNLLRLGFLRINGIAVAVLLGIEYARRFWVFKIGYNETYSKCSPGILLIHNTIKYAFENRLKSFEFLGSNQPWIHMWNCELHNYVTPHIYPYSFGGGIAFTKEVIGYFIKKTKK